MKTIYLAGGCFWGVQRYFDQFDGVVSTEVGYANGPEKAPTYQEVCRSSGHAETVKVIYDESRITLTEILGYYFMVIDPLSVNKQGNDGESSIGQGSTIRMKISCQRHSRFMRRKRRRWEPRWRSSFSLFGTSTRPKNITRSIW